jgi:predicted Zn-dependent protease
MSRRTLLQIEAARPTQRAFLLLMLLLALLRTSSAQNNTLDVAADATRSPAVAGAHKSLNAYHAGNIRDIDAIGNRDVGCERGLASRYSLEEQVELGRSLARAMDATFTLVTDPIITRYINRIGQDLAQNSDAQVPFTFAVIQNKAANAMSLPGGFVFVDSGLILAADNEAELAGALSHEIGHIAACHAAQVMAREELANSNASMPLMFRIAARRMTASTVYVKPTAVFEAEADLLGLQYLYRTGYDPQALPSLFERIKAVQKQRPSHPAKATEFYSQLSDRAEKARHEIDTLLPPAAEYKLDTSEFHDVKQRLLKLQDRHEHLTLK